MEPRQIYITIEIIGLFILVGELLYVSLQKPSALQKHLIIILLTIAISFIGYIVELYGETKTTAFVGICVGYLGKPFALLASMLLLLEYANIKVKKWFVVAFSLYFIALTLIVVTNHRHHLYYAVTDWDENKINGSRFIIKSYGPFWYVYMVSSFLVFFSYSAVVIFEFINSKTKQAKQMAVLLFMVVFCAFLGLTLYLAKATYGFDTTLLGILVGSIFLLILFTRYRMFSTIANAQHMSLDASKDGMLILDARNTISYYNKTMTKLYPELNKNLTRKIANEVIKDVESLNQKDYFFVEDKVYKVSEIAHEVGNRKPIVVGKTFTFQDVTSHYHQSEILAEEVNKATEKIKNIQREALISLAAIVEARDGNTGEHIQRVANVSYAIAKRLKETQVYKFDERYLLMIKECAPLHDIGKVYIPDGVLLKPGKLTAEEFETIKTHTTYGAKIVDESIKPLEEEVYSKTARDIALSHHERWDGTGYPEGLKENSIPISARIVAVADVYDALCMKRCYKEAYTKAEAIEIIKQESGTHFDPTIVKAFLEIVDQL